MIVFKLGLYLSRACIATRLFYFTSPQQSYTSAHTSRRGAFLPQNSGVNSLTIAIRMDKVFKWGGLAALVYVILLQAGSWLSQKISVGAIKMQLGQTTPSGQQITLQIPVANTAPVAYPLEAFHGVLQWGANPLAQVIISNPVTIAANSTTTIPVSVFVPFANLGTQIVNIIQQGNWLAGANIKGMLRAGGINVPIQQSIQLL